ncbi:MAG: D-aminoacylase [Armatimonadetes bacterium]|nr:D-aminoacylase [Armatimonadota bacterium]MDW8027963.1 D-aminoacylase [Armatimonadota bacterium]
MNATNASNSAQVFDWLIVNGRVIDGTGQAPFFADIGLVGNKIAAIGQLFHAKAKNRIDATGKFIAPGFIDIHTHFDTALFVHPEAYCALSQGVTTVVIGNCGHSPVPIPDERRNELRKLLPVIEAGIDWKWRKFSDYLEDLEAIKPAVNIISLVGHCALRASVVGFENRPATEDELKAMQKLLEDCMDEGAWGLSSGLIYPPSAFANFEELVALTEVVAKRGGLYSTHMRSESDALVSAVTEALQTALKSGAKLQISHHKAAHKPNWGKVAVTLGMIEQTALQHDVNIDAYPYTAGSSYLAQLLPLWALEGGASALLERLKDKSQRQQINEALERDEKIDWSEVIIASVASEEYQPLQGKTVKEVSKMLGLTPSETVLHLIEHEQNAVNMVWFVMDEQDVERVLTHPLCLVGSDALTVPAMPDAPEPKPYVHPRTYGTFPKVLRWLVREKGKLTWQEAIAKMTGKTAFKLGLKKRGLIKEGYFADLVVFDPNEIADCANYENPHLSAKGIDFVFVNGVPAIAEGQPTKERSGQVLKFGSD